VTRGRSSSSSSTKPTCAGKHAAHLLENVLGCWEETGDLRAILEYETFDTAGTRSVLDAVEAAESAHKDLVDYSIPDTLSVAVVGEAQFTPLDRSVLPQEYDAVDPFETGSSTSRSSTVSPPRQTLSTLLSTTSLRRTQVTSPSLWIEAVRTRPSSSQH